MHPSHPIVADGLERSFGSGDDVVRAVDGVDLQIEAGEVFGFLGPNGAGKSTTVRMLTTLLRPTGGTARVAGYDVVAEADHVRRNIGVALQDAAIDPLMTGMELLLLQAVLYGLPRHEHRSRAGDLLERVGLSAAADRRVGTYSGGMQRRINLGCALLHRPKLLLLMRSLRRSVRFRASSSSAERNLAAEEESPASLPQKMRFSSSLIG